MPVVRLIGWRLACAPHACCPLHRGLCTENKRRARKVENVSRCWSWMVIICILTNYTTGMHNTFESNEYPGNESILNFFSRSMARSPIRSTAKPVVPPYMQIHSSIGFPVLHLGPISRQRITFSPFPSMLPTNLDPSANCQANIFKNTVTVGDVPIAVNMLLSWKQNAFVLLPSEKREGGRKYIATIHLSQGAQTVWH